MVKAEDFWDYLCNELNYRFFSGFPCVGLNPLYDKMDSGIMHYIPAVKENIALGLVSGAFLAGAKGGILIDLNSLHNIMYWLSSFNLEYKVPLIIITYCDDINKYDRILSFYKIPKVILNNDFKKCLKSITNKTEKLEVPGIIIVGKGVLKE